MGVWVPLGGGQVDIGGGRVGVSGFWVTFTWCLLGDVRWNWVLWGAHHPPASVDIPR